MRLVSSHCHLDRLGPRLRSRREAVGLEDLDPVGGVVGVDLDLRLLDAVVGGRLGERPPSDDAPQLGEDVADLPQNGRLDFLAFFFGGLSGM